MIFAKALDAAKNFANRNAAPGVAFVTDHSGWANDLASRSVSRHLRERHGLAADVVLTPRGLRGQIVHFIDRHIFLRPGMPQQIHRSNRVFLTWFHQDPRVSAEKVAALRVLMPAVIARVESVVVPCELTKRAIIALGVPEAKIVTIPLGVDLQLFGAASAADRAAARERLHIPADAICIGSFQKDGAGWGEGGEPKLIKGPDVFLSALERLRDHGFNLHVLLSGPARGFLKTGLRRLGIAFTHAAVGEYREVVPLYHALDLYVIASRCEGGPLGLMESWATGVPVVSTRVGMPADVVRHGENGMLAESEDATGLADACAALLASRALRDACRERGLEEVKELEWSVIAAKYYALYQPFVSARL